MIFKETKTAQKLKNLLFQTDNERYKMVNKDSFSA